MRYGLVCGAFLFLVIFAYNIYYQPFQYPPNNQRGQTETIARFVIAQTNNQPYNFALLSAGNGNSNYAYVYYLTILGHPPLQMDNMLNDPQRKTVTDQLMVVCEDINCKPLGNSLFDVAGFGRAAV